MTARQASVVAFVVILAFPGAMASGGVREQGDVWVTWSLARNLDKAAAEAARVPIPTGVETAMEFYVQRPTDAPIHAVTLVLQPSTGDLTLRLGETRAGDPAQGDYAYWPTLDGEASTQRGFVMAVLGVADTAQGDVTIDALVFYRDAAGVERFSKTVLAGTFLPAPIYVHVSMELLAASIGLALFSVGVGAAYVRQRRQGTAVSDEDS